MKTTFRILAALLLAALLLALVVAALGANLAAPFEHAVIRIDGDDFTFANIGGFDALLAAGAVLVGLAVAAVVVLVVVPFALLLPLVVMLCVAGALVGGALLAVLGVVALATSPVLIFGLLIWAVWRLARGPKRAATIAT